MLDNQIERIALFGPLLPFPHSGQVEGELRELRCHYGNVFPRLSLLAIICVYPGSIVS